MYKLPGFFHGPLVAVKFELAGHNPRVSRNLVVSRSFRGTFRRCSLAAGGGRWWKSGGAKGEERGESRDKSLRLSRDGGESLVERIREAVWNILTYITVKLERGYATANLSLPATFHPRVHPFCRIAGSVLRYPRVLSPRDLTFFFTKLPVFGRYVCLSCRLRQL